MRKLILTVISTLFISGSSWALTLSSIRSSVRIVVNDSATDTTLQTYSDANILKYVNEGQRDVVNQTWALHTSTGYLLTAACTYYALPDNLIAVEAVTFKDRSGNTYELKATSRKSVFGDNPDYEKQVGAPMQYLVRRSTYGANSLEIAYIPIPTTISTGTVRAYYTYSATDLSSDTDVPYDGELYLYLYHDLLIYYTVARLLLLEGRQNDAAAYATLYTNGLSLMAVNLGKESINYNPGARPATK